MSTADVLPRNALQPRLDLALEAARRAAAITMDLFRSPRLQVEDKRDGTPVTEADRNAELRMREIIGREFGADGIEGEEHGVKEGSSGFRWILDPIDGTQSFIHGVPIWGTMIGIEHDGKMVAGVIHHPALEEMVYGAAGLGAWWIDQARPPVRARVSSVGKIAAAAFTTTTSRSFVDAGRWGAYERLQAACRRTRGWGECYGFTLVATGRAELFVEPVMAPWDIAAGVSIIEEAGGKGSTLEGSASIRAGHWIASNGAVHEEALRLVRG